MQFGGEASAVREFGVGEKRGCRPPSFSFERGSRMPTRSPQGTALTEIYGRCERIKTQFRRPFENGKRYQLRETRSNVLETKKIDKLRVRACLDLALPSQEAMPVIVQTAIERASEDSRVGRSIPRNVRELLVLKEGETIQHRLRISLDEIDRACRRKKRTLRSQKSKEKGSKKSDGLRQVGLLSNPAIAWGCDSAFYWLFKHEIPNGKDFCVFERALPCRSDPGSRKDAFPGDPVPRAFAANTDWETARFCLETLLGMQNVPEDCNNTQDLSGLCAHSVRVSDWTLNPSPLSEQDLLKAGDFVVIFRKPTGPRTPQNPYVPLRFTPGFLMHSLTRYDSSEQELDAFLELMGDAESQNYRAPGTATHSLTRKPIELEAEFVCEYSCDSDESAWRTSGEDETRTIRARKWHIKTITRDDEPSDEFLPARSTRVRPDYVCYRCGTVGEHFIALCPTNQDPDYIPLYAKRRPLGVPRNALVAVRDPKDVGRARYYANGQFYLHLSNPSDAPTTFDSTANKIGSVDPVESAGGAFAHRWTQS